VGGRFGDRKDEGEAERARTGGRDPLEMLERSHRRIEEHLAAMIQAAGAIARGAPGDHVAVIDDSLAFLERSATRHEVDEEGSLFPRLRRHTTLARLLEALTDDHHRHHQLHVQLRTQRAQWPPAGPDAADGARLVNLVAELGRAYRSHIEREELELLPAVRTLLAPEELAAVLVEMGQRRGREPASPRSERTESTSPAIAGEPRTPRALEGAQAPRRSRGAGDGARRAVAEARRVRDR
jgi:hemerythrin-like domain-containing protein